MLDWSHNVYYQRLLLRHLPRPCRRVLDVGCGTGAFAARLAERVDQVDAVDRSERMIEQARRHTPHNVTCVLADVLVDPLPGKDYDAIVSITALHHLPLADALEVLAAALRPGGVLAAVVLPRVDLRREWPVEIIAMVGHRLLGVIFLANRLLRGTDPFAKERHVDTGMPVVMDPPLTTRQAARVAAGVLPGARVRRLLFWRYLLVWEKPILHDNNPAAAAPTSPTLDARSQVSASCLADVTARARTDRHARTSERGTHANGSPPWARPGGGRASVDPGGALGRPR
ncbi:class I SAM-dependent methyltransferase [Frankia sp. AgB32]|uniref:class I SAM-dependent methyltransferase n=1 Tax=Frankia sp. AgB32 TaxID=631119 RepID=UPI00200CD378|nr:class I SAM-dependent methyltransferase [Frankia sp. AgB32]MCK9897695.1 class I SAM-dependent methyltransferase [Frankia sp. AgB32]